MTKLSGKKSKKIIFFELIFSKTLLNQNFMLIPIQKTVSSFQPLYLKVSVSETGVIWVIIPKNGVIRLYRGNSIHFG